MKKAIGLFRIATAAIAFTSLPLPALAAIVGGQAETITALYSYPQYGGGDVVIVVSPSLSSCESGFWISPSDPGFKSVYAQLLVAWTARSVIRVWAYDDQIWLGSFGRTCRIQAIGGDPP